jgi:LAO/AO transport system kinase
MSLVDQVRAGDRLALARLLTQIENEEEAGRLAQTALFPASGQAHLIGVTGAPGTGKSTLVNQLTLCLRRGTAGASGASGPVNVAVVAVDPSSPFTGGAILGDRIRMRDLAGDDGVFIRSMASRGALGGLARTTSGVVETLDAAGYQVILIETVGAGQAEVDIARTAHTTIVVMAPSLGDEIQAIKAGILEIADIVVVNKFDLPAADQTLSALRAALELGTTPQAKTDKAVPEGPSGPPARSWRPLVLPAVAAKGEGIDRIVQALCEHRSFLVQSGELRKREEGRLRAQMEQMLREELADRFLRAQPDGRFESALELVLDRKQSVREAVDGLLEGNGT